MVYRKCLNCMIMTANTFKHQNLVDAILIVTLGQLPIFMGGGGVVFGSCFVMQYF